MSWTLGLISIDKSSLWRTPCSVDVDTDDPPSQRFTYVVDQFLKNRQMIGVICYPREFESVEVGGAKIMQAARPQIGCYMESHEATCLNEYAKRIGVKRPILVFLLVLRELRCARLAELRPRYPYKGKREGLRRVTARLPSQSLKNAFEKHIAGVGMGSDEAAWALFKSELAEQWLDKSLMSGNQS